MLSIIFHFSKSLFFSKIKSGTKKILYIFYIFDLFRVIAFLSRVVLRVSDTIYCINLNSVQENRIRNIFRKNLNHCSSSRVKLSFRRNGCGVPSLHRIGEVNKRLYVREGPGEWRPKGCLGTTTLARYVPPCAAKCKVKICRKRTCGRISLLHYHRITAPAAHPRCAPR